MPTHMKQRHFNDLATRWDSLPAPSDAGAKAGEFVRRAVPASARRILDVGCGTGILLAPLLSICPSVASIVELDFAEAMLRESTRKVVDPRVQRICSDARQLPFRGESFDVILCFGVLPHFEDSEATLRELFRVLRPAGVLGVGHALGSRELNALHHGLGGPLAHDTLPGSEALAQMLRRWKARVPVAEERPDWYYVCAVKERS